MKKKSLKKWIRIQNTRIDRLEYDCINHCIDKEKLQDDIVKKDNEINSLKKKLLDEEQVGIRARRIYQSLQGSNYPELTLKEKAMNLYLFAMEMQSPKDWDAKSESYQEIWMQKFIDVSSKKMVKEEYDLGTELWIKE